MCGCVGVWVCGLVGKIKTDYSDIRDSSYGIGHFVS